MTKKPTPRLDKLFNRVLRVCANKSELARRLGVTSSHIQKWVTAREYEPGGEITLAMLEWVQAEEAKQQKSPGRAETRPEPKTRKRKSRNENLKSGQT